MQGGSRKIHLPLKVKNLHISKESLKLSEFYHYIVACCELIIPLHLNMGFTFKNGMGWNMSSRYLVTLLNDMPLLYGKKISIKVI